MQHLLLKSAARDEIEHEDLALLADTVDTAYALLDRHGIPRYVEIDQRVAELDVAPLATGFGTQQHGHSLAERCDGCVFVRAAEAAFETRELQTVALEQAGEVVERLAVMYEHQFLFARIMAQQVEQRRLLAPGFQRSPSLRQLAPGRVIRLARGKARDRASSCRRR